MDPVEKLISVIIPVYNGELFLKEALDSVVRQDYRPIEIIVVDDGSSDGTGSIAKSFGHDLRYISQENKGPSAARNRGIKMARGSVIAFLDADDVWPDDKLTMQMSYLDKQPGVQAVFGMAQFIVAFRQASGMTEIKKYDGKYFVYGIGNALFRRAVFDIAGFFDEKLRLSEDTDFFMRMREKGVNVHLIRETTLLKRIHQTNVTNDKEACQAAFIKAMKMSVDRRKLCSEGIAKLWMER